MAARVVTIFINTDRFSSDPQYSNSVTYELAYATDATEELLGWALRGLEQLFRRGYKYKKAGVMLANLVPADQLSIRLYGDARFERSRKLAKAMDKINQRYGRDTVMFGVARPDGRWKTRFLRRSKRYTTSLKEVLSIH
jgi:DNA polymerase V